jgi:uncharacterized protein (DUF58 family)
MNRAARRQGPGDLTVSAVILFTLGAYGVAAGSVTGEERAVAVGVFAFTLFAVGIIWPVVTLSRVSVAVSAPAEGMVGDELPLRVTLYGRASRVEVRVLDPPGAWWRATVPSEGVLTHVANRRGVFTHVRVQIRTSAPLGVFMRVRQARVALPVPIVIAPMPTRAAAHLGPVPERAQQPAPHTARGASGDVVRAVRPYVAGDAVRLVHWATSARRGELVVREHDPPANEGLALVVDLSGPEDWADDAASVAAGAGRAALARGAQLVLVTREVTGPRCAAVADVRELGHRLAHAVGGPPGDPPQDWPVQFVRATDRTADDRLVLA